MKYNILGDPLPVVICEVEPGETLITENGAMSWMTPNMNMETTSTPRLDMNIHRRIHLITPMPLDCWLAHIVTIFISVLWYVKKSTSIVFCTKTTCSLR